MIEVGQSREENVKNMSALWHDLQEQVLTLSPDQLRERMPAFRNKEIRDFVAGSDYARPESVLQIGEAIASILQSNVVSVAAGATPPAEAVRLLGVVERLFSGTPVADDARREREQLEEKLQKNKASASQPSAVNDADTEDHPKTEVAEQTGEQDSTDEHSYAFYSLAVVLALAVAATIAVIAVRRGKGNLQK